jgi:pimeloyl-ACP methyl ester carboxylesterase
MVKSVQLSNNLQLPYIERGNPSTVPLIFLHGFAGSWRDFKPVFDFLSKSVHAIALTQRGHGDASHPKTGYRLSNFSDDLVQLMKINGIHKAVIIGHSMGSAVAQRFAIDYPDQTLGLVLIGASITRPGDSKVREFFDSTVSRLVDPIEPDFVDQFITGMRVKPIPEELFEEVLQEAHKVPARVWIEAFEGRLLENISEKIGLINCPTLLIWGDQDHRSLRSDQNELLREISDSRLKVYSETGHLLHLEEPKRLASDIEFFLEEIKERSAS